MIILCVWCLQSTAFYSQDGHIRGYSVQFLTQLPIKVRYCGPWAPRFHLNYLKISDSEYLFLGCKQNLFMNVNYMLRCSILLTQHRIYTQCEVCTNIGASAVDFVSGREASVMGYFLTVWRIVAFWSSESSSPERNKHPKPSITSQNTCIYSNTTVTTSDLAHITHPDGFCFPLH